MDTSYEPEEEVTSADDHQEVYALPGVMLSEGYVHVLCLKCGWGCEVREFSFICPFCLSSNFEIDASPAPLEAVGRDENIEELSPSRAEAGRAPWMS